MYAVLQNITSRPAPLHHTTCLPACPQACNASPQARKPANLICPQTSQAQGKSGPPIAGNSANCLLYIREQPRPAYLLHNTYHFQVHPPIHHPPSTPPYLPPPSPSLHTYLYIYPLPWISDLPLFSTTKDTYPTYTGTRIEYRVTTVTVE
ncbi:hypothetical protein K504DRAFT_144253 [Pleomassaria siparia CBS 279.74]|uniref:Uncharacterized protein n=1 Tax=Pleomassaria siparia CBS 279.74 TaxID=1314801 RepID=A0A6G1KMG7_9PLEO|nr:hypothetical protein K504DRAFT_144253 [Pleomassaria siparia CBS 279.74]